MHSNVYKASINYVFYFYNEVYVIYDNCKAFNLQIFKHIIHNSQLSVHEITRSALGLSKQRVKYTGFVHACNTDNH